MKRPFRVAGTVVLIGLLLFALWAVRTRSAIRSDQSLKDTIQSEIKARFTGGIGAVLQLDPATGVPLIRKVMAGSPAEKAGLLEGDRILQIEGIATSGQTLKQNLDRMRGFIAGSVTLVVQRSGSTNLD